MGPDTRARIAWFLNVVGPFLGLLLVIGLFSIRPEVRAGFLTGGNFKIIFTQTVIVASCALGMTMMLLGSVGQWFWQTPQPVQPSSFTMTCRSTISMALTPIGQSSTQTVQSSPLARLPNRR